MQLDSRSDVRLTEQMNYIHIELEIYFNFSKFILFTIQSNNTINTYLKNNTILILFIFRNDLNSNKKYNTIAINSLTFNVKQTCNNPFCDVIYDIVKHCIPSMAGVKICLRTSFVLVILQHIFLVPVMSSVDISQFIPLLYFIIFQNIIICVLFKSISSLNINYLQAVASPGSGTFFSLFHKHRHSTRISPSEESIEIMESPEKSTQNKNTESILDKIRMASLASVASSMNMPTQNKVSGVSGKRQQRRTGRRNDKFLSLWQDKTTEVRNWNLMLF